MAIKGICKPALVLGLVAVALVMAAAQAATVTIYNPAEMVVNLQDNTENKRVEMTAAMMTMEIQQEQQDMQISQAGGEVVDVSVRNGDVLVLIPDPVNDSSNVIMAFKVVDDIAAAERPRPSSAHFPDASLPPNDAFNADPKPPMDRSYYADPQPPTNWD